MSVNNVHAFSMLVYKPSIYANPRRRKRGFKNYYTMKKLLFLCSACLCAGQLFAQNSSLTGGLYEHVLEVEAYDDWGKGYLTVIDNHTVIIDNATYLTAFEPVLDELSTPRNPQTGQQIVPDEAIPMTGSIIYEVNGLSTKGMKPKKFYSLIDTATVFTLQYENSERNIVTYSFKRYKEMADVVYHFNLDFSKDDDVFEYDLPHLMQTNIKYFARSEYRKRVCGNIFNEMTDENFDFHNAMTYDYNITSNDPLNDKKILDEIPKEDMVQDTQNPDIIFTITKNIEGDIYMELCALDATRKNKRKANLPIVWKMTVQREKQKNENIIDTYKDYAAWANYPLNDRYVYSEYPLYKTLGVEINNARIVTKVYKNALFSFLQEGDEIIKVESYRNFQARNETSKYSWFNVNYKDVLKKEQITEREINKYLCFWPHFNYIYYDWECRNVNDYIIITYKHNGKKMKYKVTPQSAMVKREYLCDKEHLPTIK